MKATYMFGPGDVRIVDAPGPVLKDTTDAVVRIVRACVCGSDLHPYHSMARTPDGVSMGHEFIGVVEEVGSDVHALIPGDLSLLDGTVNPGKVFDRTIGLDAVPDGYRAMDDREALKVMIAF